LVRKVCEAATFALGASLTTVHRSCGEEIDSFLGLDPRTPSCALLPIGWPLGRYGRPPRDPVDSKLHFERYEPPE
jgi:hypothetical protein